MDAKLLVSLAGGLVVLALLVWLLRSRHRDEPMLNGRGALPRMSSTFGAAPPRVTVELGREVLAMLEAGEREQAVRLARERAGLDAAQAEAIIARVERLRERLEA